MDQKLIDYLADTFLAGTRLTLEKRSDMQHGDAFHIWIHRVVDEKELLYYIKAASDADTETAIRIAQECLITTLMKRGEIAVFGESDASSEKLISEKYVT